MADHFTCVANSSLKRRGAWAAEEDNLLKECIQMYGEGSWHHVPTWAGLQRCGRSCRFRWLNYLSPDINRGGFSGDEDELIMRLHKLLGNRWTLIAGRLPGRTANDIKNYWTSHLSKKVSPDYKKETCAKGKKPKPFPAVKCFKQLHVPRFNGPETGEILEIQRAPEELATITYDQAPTENSLPIEDEKSPWFLNATDQLLPLISENKMIEEECFWDGFLKGLELHNDL